MADVFVGFFYDEDMESELLAISKAGISSAANQYQKGFLSGMGQQMQILTTLSIGIFPKRSKRLIFRRKDKECREGWVTYLPFVDFYFVKNWTFRRGLYRELKRIISSQAHTNIYVYSLNVVFEKVMARLKRKFADKFNYCLIIPDLPGNYGIVRKGIKGIKDRLETKPKMELASWADRYVFLTEAMRELFPAKPYTVIEGFLPAGEFDYTQQRIPKTILYTGTLGEKFGLQTLLDAFAMIDDPEYQLWICGSGTMEQQIRKAAEKDSRIQFKGFLPKKQIAQLQTQCDILINPRTDEGEYTKYSFPSKTMEYLLSGSKVVMHRLSGVGDEYYRYIHTLASSSAVCMKQTIVAACEDQQFYGSTWKEQVAWIRNNKNASYQVGKLYDKDC